MREAGSWKLGGTAVPVTIWEISSRQQQQVSLIRSQVMEGIDVLSI